ncbi:LysE family translocator [Minwuia sp.]|uniref:LysE family translocator n=1 Tax=Minwuia sp. TaxID=2493630 RepID=UPI003A926DCF
MPPLDLLIPFALASLIFACSPGPGMLYTAAQTVAHGRRAGWRAILALHLAEYVHVAAAAFGLAALLQAVPVLYTVMKIAGAAYLIWLGIRMLRANSNPFAAANEPAARPATSTFAHSLAVGVLNPKAAAFYLAFLPQFTDPSAGLPIWAQVLVLGVAVNVLFTMTDTICVLLSDRLGALLRRSQKAVRRAQKISGGILIGLGASLALSKQ